MAEGEFAAEEYLKRSSPLWLKDKGACGCVQIIAAMDNPLIVMAIMGYMGYRKRTGFLAGLTVAQISEFSIVFVAMGISLGHVWMRALGLTTLVSVVTSNLSAYMILYSHIRPKKDAS